MQAQFQFFTSRRIAGGKQPIIAGLNYFLTEEARGGSSKKLLGEKRDVKAWLAWLERRAHGEVEAIRSPIGYLPRFEDLRCLFDQRIGKDYPEKLYHRQFSLYVDNIVARIDLQRDAYRKEVRIPQRFFEILENQRGQLEALKRAFGPVVGPDQIDSYKVP